MAGYTGLATVGEWLAILGWLLCVMATVADYIQITDRPKYNASKPVAIGKLLHA